LWDKYFHSHTRSGDTVRFKILYYGKPVQGAKAWLTTAKRWTKELITDKNGMASFQLIRDYYPERWSDFRNQHKDSFTVTAKYESKER